MRTLIIVAVGVGVAVALMRFVPAPRRALAASLFSLVWAGLMLWNLSVGLSHGYTLAQEAPIHLVLFGAPVATAWVLARKGV